MNVIPAGIEFVNVTCFAVAGPLLVSDIKKLILSPTFAVVLFDVITTATSATVLLISPELIVAVPTEPVPLLLF